MAKEALERIEMILEEATASKDAVSYVTSDDAEALKKAVEALKQMDILDNIKAEIEAHCGLLQENHCKFCFYCNCMMGIREIVEVIDKHRKEG